MNNKEYRPCPNCQSVIIDWEKFTKNTPYICQNCHCQIKAKPIASTLILIALPISTTPIFLYAKTRFDLGIGLCLTFILMIAIYLLSAKIDAIFSPLYLVNKK